jgi:pilus assembly protein CpaF
VPIRQLVVNSLRMRPDRIVVGEVRGSEALDMLQAMNTGHDGSMTTLHSNGPRDTLARLETMVMMSGIELPHRAIREQIASAVDVIVHQERLFDGSRKVTNIAEVQGMEGDVIILQDIFRFEQTGMARGKVQGQLKSTGVRPKFEVKLARNGVKLPDNLFASGVAHRFGPGEARGLGQAARGGH